MFYTVYKITNLVNDKIYIGVHKTEDINDDYMGSGTVLKRAQEKYGIENFQKEILEVFDNPEDMFNMESELVNEDFVKDDTTYNLKLGGQGGWDSIKDWSHIHIFSKKDLEKAKKALKYLYENDRCWLEKKNKAFTKSILSYYENGGTNGFLNKNHTEETKKKIGEYTSIHQKGEGNSQFGTMWIYSLEEKRSKKIPKSTNIPKGWLKGRKIKF